MSGWTAEFQNALAWFAAAPGKIADATAEKIGQALDAAEAGYDWAADKVAAGYEWAKETAAAAAEWLWVVIQGDFADDPTTGQIVANTVISMIPFVDQVCDVRDIVANCMMIYEGGDKDDEESSTFWNWVALVLTLIGLFPTLGSFFKGCFKVLFRYIRKALAKSGGAKMGEAIWKIVSPMLEQGIVKLNEFLARPAVRKVIAEKNLDNIYKEIAKQIREVAQQVNKQALLGIMDDMIGKLKPMVEFIQKWGGAALGTKAGRLLEIVNDVRRKADAKIGKFLEPAQDLLDRTAKRLDLEYKAGYKATTNAATPHHFYNMATPNAASPRKFARVADEATEVAAIQRNKPSWVDVHVGGNSLPHPRCDVNDFDVAYQKALADFNAGKLSQMPTDMRQPGALKEKYNTFGKNIHADVIPEGTVLYRVLDPSSNDNSICWYTKAEFESFLNKSDWRRRSAVWGYWNGNGEVVTYTVPPGGLPVWRGRVASQLDSSKRYMLEGGAEQLVIDPLHLDERYMNARKATGWGYDDLELGHHPNMVGVPTLRKDWYDNEELRQQRVMDMWGE